MVLGAAEFKTGDTTTFEGKRVKIVSTQFDFVVIEDESGNRSSVRKDALKSTPLFNFYSEEVMKERKEQIAHFQDKARKAEKQKNIWLDKIKDYRAQMRGLDKSDEEYKLLKDECLAASLKKTSFGNQAFSNFMQAFMIASDPIA